MLTLRKVFIYGLPKPYKKEVGVVPDYVNEGKLKYIKK